LDIAELFIATDMTPCQLVSEICASEKSRNDERFATRLTVGYEDHRRAGKLKSDR